MYSSSSFLDLPPMNIQNTQVSHILINFYIYATSPFSVKPWFQFLNKDTKSLPLIYFFK